MYELLETWLLRVKNNIYLLYETYLSEGSLTLTSIYRCNSYACNRYFWQKQSSVIRKMYMIPLRTRLLIKI